MMEEYIAQMANKGLAPHDGDYEKGGLVYCGKCNTPRQTVIDLFGKRKVVSVMCRCASGEYDRKQAELKADEERLRIKRLRTSGLRDKNYLRWTFDLDDGRTPQMDKARKYCDNWKKFYHDGTGLLLWGNVGTAKTFFAACIANALLARGVPVLMTNFIQLANGLRGFDDNNAYIRSLDNYKLLIIDDLGAERGSEYMQEKVYEIIDARYRNGQPMIATTNLTLAEIEKPKDMSCARIYDRILEMTVPIRFDGVARRSEIHNDKIADAAALLR